MDLARDGATYHAPRQHRVRDFAAFVYLSSSWSALRICRTKMSNSMYLRSALSASTQPNTVIPRDSGGQTQLAAPQPSTSVTIAALHSPTDTHEYHALIRRHQFRMLHSTRVATPGWPRSRLSSFSLSPSFYCSRSPYISSLAYLQPHPAVALCSKNMRRAFLGGASKV